MAQQNETLKEVGIFALGAAAGILLARAATPLAAQTIGTARAAHHGGDAFDELVADHREVTALLEKAERASGAERMKLFLVIKRALSKHAIAEEDVIYPLVAEKLDAANGAKHLYEEHGEMKELLAQIEGSLEVDDDLRYRDAVRRLLTTVREHAAEEEEQWFPRLRERLDARSRALVTGKVDREKALLA